MPKRQVSSDPEEQRPHKSARLTTKRFECMSDELLLRILSFLPVETLALCQSVSHRLLSIAGDAGLWRRAYHIDFVQPRIARLSTRARKAKAVDRPQPAYALNWLDEKDLVREGSDTDWKHRYKIRHRWSRGVCELDEIPLSDSPPTPPLLARMCHGIIYTVDSENGLRAWSYKNPKELVAQCDVSGLHNTQDSSKPASLAVDKCNQRGHVHQVAVGFEDGSITSCVFDLEKVKFMQYFASPSSAHGTLTTVALTWPYMVTMAKDNTLSLYQYRARRSENQGRDSPYDLELLRCLRSQTTRSPLSASMRLNADFLVVCLAFASSTLGYGWSAGLQELRFDLGGNLQDSRLAIAPASQLRIRSLDSHSSRLAAANTPTQLGDLSRPMSICYSHPYLLTAHADNTLTLYMVTRTTARLTIGSRTRLWGHTSSVYGAHVESKGRAVSVSSRGGEIRIWHLEGAATVPENLGALGTGQSSISVIPGKRSPPTEAYWAGDRQSLSQSRYDWESARGSCDSVTRGWIGFDEENVVVLKERPAGNQSILVYDFT